MKTKLMITLTLCALSLTAASQETYDLTIDKVDKYGAPPDAYVVNCRLWVPNGTGTLQYVVLMMPEHENDSRPKINDEGWQGFARKNSAALLAFSMTKKKGGVPLYEYVENWSGKALLEALRQLSKNSNHTEVATAPLLVWGNSEAGGEMSYNFANWKPNRVAAFVAGKAGSKTVAEPQSATARMPGLFVGGQRERLVFKDLYDKGRERGAAWCYAIEDGPQYTEWKAEYLSRAFFEQVIARRATQNPDADSDAGVWYGNLKDFTIAAAGNRAANDKTLTWLPDETFARVWRIYVTGKDVE